MNDHKHAAKASAAAKLARMTSTHTHGTSSAGDGVNEEYGTRAAGVSDSAAYKRGGAIAGGKAKTRLDRSSREAFKRGGAVKGNKGKTVVNIVVGRDAPQQVPMPVPVGGPPPGGPPSGMVPPRPPVPMPNGPMPGPGMPPPGPMMGRKSGGRVVMKGGAGSGLGRLEKTADAKRK